MCAEISIGEGSKLQVWIHQEVVSSEQGVPYRSFHTQRHTETWPRHSLTYSLCAIPPPCPLYLTQ